MKADVDGMFADDIDRTASSVESTADAIRLSDGVTAKETDNGINSTGLRTLRTRGLTAWYPSNTSSSSESSGGSHAAAATSEGAFDVEDPRTLVGSFAVEIEGIGWSAVASVVVWLGELTGVVSVSTAAVVEAFGLASSDEPGDLGRARGDTVGSENPVGSNRKARLNT